MSNTASEKCAHPRKRGGEGDVEQKVHEVRFFVVPEQLRGGDALDLGVKMRKEVRMAQRHPVEKENVVDLHDIEDDEVAREKRAEGETVFDALQPVELRSPVVENGDAGAEGRDGGKVQVGGDDLLFPAALG